jgi:hypothetical protein
MSKIHFLMGNERNYKMILMLENKIKSIKKKFIVQIEK